MANFSPFQTAKALANTFGKEDSQSNNESNTNTKFTFQRAGAVLQSSNSSNKKHSEAVAEEASPMEIDYDQMPFSEEQIKEFGGHSNLLLGFQTAKQCESEKLNIGITSDEERKATSPLSSCMSVNDDLSKPTAHRVDEPKEVLEDINKILSKYEESNESKGPKKKVIFNKKNTSKSKSSVMENISEPNVQDRPVTNVTTSTDSEKFPVQSPTSSKNEDFDKKKIVFGRKLRCKKTVNYKEITDKDEHTETSENVETKCEEDKNVPKKKVVFRKTSSGATEVPIIVPRQLVDSLPDNKYDDLESNSDSGSEVSKIVESKEHGDIKRESNVKKKVVFKKPAKKSRPETSLFKVPDTEEFLKIKEKTQRAPSSSPEKAPQKVRFGRTRASTTKKTSTAKSNLSRNIGNSKVATRNQPSTITKNSQTFKGPVLGAPPLDAKAELSALDNKPVRGVLAKAMNLNRKTFQVIAASATSVCEPEDCGPEFSWKKPKVEIQKPVDVPLGPPIKVPTCLPNLLDAYTRGGQRILFSPNEARPLLFQSRAAAEWWDAATYTNFRRMKLALERGEYLHPQLSRGVEDEVRGALEGIEGRVAGSVRHLESRVLAEKYILCQWEASLITASCRIDQWLHESFDMSPCALNALSRLLDRLLGVPITLVMIKKTMFLTTFFWSLCDLKHGMWARVLAKKANAVLQHFRESLALSQPFTKAHYEAFLFDLIADFRLAIEPLPFHERLLITHTLAEENSWTRRETLVLNTKPDANETTLDGYEFTENDQKNLVILKLLLRFPNEISDPIFLPRNRTENPPRKLFGFKECTLEAKNLPVEVSSMEEAEDYDYYDSWNFKTIPKRINRSVGKTKGDVNLKPILRSDDAYNVNAPTLHTTGSANKRSDKIINEHNKLGTFDYNNAENVASKNPTVVTETWKDLMPAMNVSLANEETTVNEMMCARTIDGNQRTKVNELIPDVEMDQNDPAVDVNQACSSNDPEIQNTATETCGFLSDTFRILHDDSNEHYMEVAETPVGEDLSGMIQNTFNSQDLKLIYNILENEKLALVPDADTVQTNGNTMDSGSNEAREYLFDINNNVVDINNNVVRNSQSQEDAVPDLSDMEGSDELYMDETAHLYEDKRNTFPCDLDIIAHTRIKKDPMIDTEEALEENNNGDLVNPDKTVELNKDQDTIACDLTLVIKWLDS